MVSNLSVPICFSTAFISITGTVSTTTMVESLRAVSVLTSASDALTRAVPCTTLWMVDARGISFWIVLLEMIAPQSGSDAATIFDHMALMNHEDRWYNFKAITCVIDIVNHALL